MNDHHATTVSADAADAGDSDTAPQNAPVVFISYAHETRAHKNWVVHLARDLRANHIDAILDQWDLEPGADVPHFMESGIRSSDRVLLICTPAYARKANAGEGGVGYERMVVTAELAHKLLTTKFVCILRDGDASSAIPTFASSRLHVDFRDDALYEDRLEELLRALLDAPSEPRPELGPDPFASASVAQVATSRQTPQPDEIDKPLDAEDAFRKAEFVLRGKDLLGWHQLVLSTRRVLNPRLHAWRAKTDEIEITNANWPERFDSAVTEGAPLMALALTAVQSDIGSIADQTALLDDFLHIDEWNRSGVNVVVAVPAGLAYVYHHVLGAYLVKSKHPDRAVGLLMTPVEDGSRHGTRPLWNASKVVGWPDALDGNARTAWKYLEQLFDKQYWLNRFFANKREFISCLRAYNLIASLVELSEFLSREGGEKITEGGFSYEVPPMFAMHDDVRRLVRLAVPDRHALEAIGVEYGVSDGALRAAWPD